MRKNIPVFSSTGYNIGRSFRVSLKKNFLELGNNARETSNLSNMILKKLKKLTRLNKLIN